jgi:hypothetical protein
MELFYLFIVQYEPLVAPARSGCYNTSKVQNSIPIIQSGVALTLAAEHELESVQNGRLVHCEPAQLSAHIL